MRSRRLALCILAVVLAALVPAPPAMGKEGVRATLETHFPLDAPAGTHLDVAWTLAYVGEDGQERPFGAGGVFVRLLSASGAGVQDAPANGDTHPVGMYAATVVVPEGGIGDVLIGLVGWRSDVTGTHRSDAFFPITNDPMPGALVARPAWWAPGMGEATWILGLGTTSLLVLAVLALVLVRGRTARRAIDRG